MNPSLGGPLLQCSMSLTPCVNKISRYVDRFHHDHLCIQDGSYNDIGPHYEFANLNSHLCQNFVGYHNRYTKTFLVRQIKNCLYVDV